jgi:hypothetical protein
MILAALYFFTLWFSWFALSRPELKTAWVRVVSWVLLLFYTFIALAPILFGDTHTRNLFYLFFAIPFGYAVVFRESTKRLAKNLPESVWVKIIVVFLLLWPIESFLVIDFIRSGYVQEYGVEKSISYTSVFALPQHLFVYIGFYVGVALVVVLFGMKRNISASWGFIVGALWGLGVEQHFLVPKSILSGNWSALTTLVPVVSLVYGWYVAGPLVFFSQKISEEKPSKRDVGIFLLLLVSIPLGMWILWQKLIGWPQ